MPREPQDDSLSTYAAKITAEDYTADFTKDSAAVSRTIRGLSPVPLCRCKLPDGKGLKIVSAVVSDENVGNAEAGTVIALSDKGRGEIVVACGSGAVSITEVRPEGKGTMKAADFVRGRKISVGDILS